MHVSPGQTAPRRGERKRPWELSAVGSGVLTAQMSLGRNDSVTPPHEVPYPFDDVLWGHPHHHPKSHFLLWTRGADTIHGRQVWK